MSYEKVQTPDPLRPVRARLKWMNESKGFGFVVAEGSSSDAFLHITALRRLGLETPGEGAEMLCTIGPGPKGPQVVEIIEILSPGRPSRESAAHRSPPESNAPVEDLTGVVKWYKPDKGFGFILPDDGQRDIFVHKSCLEKAGIDMLVPGQRVRASVRTVARGREVTRIALQQ